MENKKKHSGKQGQEEAARQQNEPDNKHASQGHSTDAKGTATNTREETQRSATTDSSRSPKNSTDDGPTGGNVR